jgi:hypothetical protein
MVVKVLECSWEPGGKWQCGEFLFKAETSVGLISWREIVPGPQYSSDSAEFEMTLNGKPIDLKDEPELPDFEVPNQGGTRAAERFRQNMMSETEAVLSKWLTGLQEAGLLEGLIDGNSEGKEERRQQYWKNALNGKYTDKPTSEESDEEH